MANIKKTVVIIGLAGLLSVGAYMGIKSIKLSNAVDKLDGDIDAFTLKEIKKNGIGIPTSIIYTISLKLNNPTSQDIVISKPYITISLKKSDGTLTKIFNTTIPDASITNIKSKASTNLKHDVELDVLTVAPKAPNFLYNLIARNKQELVIDALVDSNGITFPIRKTVSI